MLAIGLKEWKFDESLSGNFSVTLQFMLVAANEGTKLVREDKGDVVDRWVLKHVLRMKTYRMVPEFYCEPRGEPTVEAKRAQTDNVIKIRVQEPERCLQTEASYLASR